VSGRWDSHFIASDICTSDGVALPGTMRGVSNFQSALARLPGT
jgi:hypothetical protein